MVLIAFIAYNLQTPFSEANLEPSLVGKVAAALPPPLALCGLNFLISFNAKYYKYQQSSVEAS